MLFKQDQVLDEIGFYAKTVGTLKARRKTAGFIAMSFPKQTLELVNEIPDALLSCLSIAPSKDLINPQAYFAIYTHEANINSHNLNQSELKKLTRYDVVVSAAA
jgi:hypothetical protein